MQDERSQLSRGLAKSVISFERSEPLPNNLKRFMMTIEQIRPRRIMQLEGNRGLL